VSGVGTIKGITFQTVQALSDVVDLVVEGRGEAVTIEGAADVVDYEILDRDGRPVAVRQAKARQEPGTWGANELAKILCAWGEVDYADTAEFAFVTDASLSDSGQRLQDLIKDMQLHPDEAVLRQTAASFRGGLQLPSLEVLRRVHVLTRMGTAETVLAKVEMRILTLLSRARLATPEDAASAANSLLRKLFIIGGSTDSGRRTISRAEVLDALGVDEASLQGDLAWSQETAAAYRAAVAEDSLQGHGFVPMNVVAAATPRVLRLLHDPDSLGAAQSLDAVLGEQAVALVGATGEGKSTALRYLAGIAAQRGLVPVLLEAAGHTAGALPRRVRYEIETVLKRPLTAGAVQHVLAAPELLLVIDGVSEVSADTRASLSSDLDQLAAQRPVRVIAAGRDLPLTIAGAGLPDSTAVFRVTGLDHDGRMKLAAAHGHQQAVRTIEHRLGSAADNPMLFLMALSLSGDGVPRSRAEVYEQFIRGLVARAGAADDDAGLAALGVAWAEMIAHDQRTADHYSWRLALGTALDDLAALPAWRGHTSTAEKALETAQRTGLLTRSDPDSGLAPLHDSFADFLAAKSIVRQEASLPPRLNAGYDETVLFMVELAGLDDALALRPATESPLLACRVARQRQARGHADANQVGSLLQALAEGQELPVLAGSGIRLCQHDRFTGAALAGEDYQMVDAAQFDMMARENPAILMPPDTGSLQLAVTLWAAAVERAQRPSRRLFQPAPSADADQAGPLLIAYLRETRQELHRLASTSLPGTVRGRVLAAIGPPGIVGYVADPEPGHLGGLDVPIRYHRSAEYAVTRGQPPAGTGPLNLDTLARMMRLHPAVQAAREIRQALDVLTSYTWPVP
jgi:energy-coupling factor transporter ATP-binding protein EcfA2